ncbi:MAG: serine/threonine-protein kinase PknK, partial [Pseudomonadales bacterium]|nr:serine/threonine-protein kinase PknK [Pseudomonadales bacterium]
MISVPGYSNLKVIHQSTETLVYSARRSRDGTRVVLRQLRPEVASPEHIARYRKEYDVLRSLDCPYIVSAYDLIEHHGTPILVLEYLDDSHSLKRLIDENVIDLREAIFIARAIAEGLDYLHAHNIIHKDINPTNIVYSPGKRELLIIDLGIAAVLSSAALKVEASEHIEGDLPWISPEQTGRMNRSIDYRSDFYSLGATLYTLLTGQTPFPTDDSLKLVYDHIATRPVPPDRVNDRVPAALSRIVMKLLSKVPEDRYQSAHAIKQDLSRCVELLQQDSHGSIDFEVALDDIPEQLNVSERLLERQGQYDDMLESLRKVSVGETEIVACTGEAGSGKTTLIKELQREVTARGGFFVQGKHTLINSQVPYSAIHDAFADLIRQLLSRPDFTTMKHRILTALEGNTRLLSQIIPELSLIMDESDHETTTSAPLLAEAKVRLAKGLAGLLNAVAGEGAPIVLCIDNLQWTDSASIELFEPLFNYQKLPYVMLVSAYRTRELAESDETHIAITRIVANNPRIRLIHLGNLNVASVNNLISESLFRPSDETRKLAELVHAKTGGNPLAVREFLINLNNKGLLFFDRKHREWSWDMEGISNEAPTENVSEMLANKIKDLEKPTSRLLQVASCIGDEFDLDTVQNVSGLSYSETSARLSQAVGEGYLLYQPGISTKKIIYRFAHDRIQQAAYMLLNTNERRQIHTSIGQAFLHYNRENADDHIFDIVNQLNNSFESPDNDAVDKRKLAELNLTAGRKAKQAAAFQSAFKYFRTAIALYGQNVWAQYDLSLQMHLEAAETAYLCGDYQQLKLLSNMVLRYARTPLDQSRIYEVRLRALVASNELDEAISKGHEVLELLGVDIPRETSYLYTVTLVLKLLAQLARVTEKFVTRATPMKDPHLLAAMRILMIMVQAGYLTGSRETPLYVLKMTQLSMKHGMAPESSFAYPMFGALLITHAGTIDYGYRFGALANKNLDNLNLEQHCRTITLINNFILTWKHPIKDSMEPLINAYRIGMETGDIEFALVAAITRSSNAFILGHDLNSLESNLAGYNRSASEFNQTPMLSMGSIYQQAVINLIHPGDTPWLLEGVVYKERERVEF